MMMIELVSPQSTNTKQTESCVMSSFIDASEKVNNGDTIHLDERFSRGIELSQLIEFREQGFIRFDYVLSTSTVASLNNRLEYILRGQYDRGRPDKAPKKLKSSLPEICPGTEKYKNNIGPLGFSGNTKNVRVMQVINVHKADRLFRKLVTMKELGELVSKLMGWKDGARLAQDQVWAK